MIYILIKLANNIKCTNWNYKSIQFNFKPKLRNAKIKIARGFYIDKQIVELSDAFAKINIVIFALSN